METKTQGRRFFGGVMSGQSGLRWVVGPDSVVHGRILGAAHKPEVTKPRAQCRVRSALHHEAGFRYRLWRLRRNVHGSSSDQSVAGESRFTIRNLIPGELVVTFGKRTIKLNVDKPTSEFTIDLNEKPKEPAKRLVVLRFVGPDPGLVPSGQVSVYASDEARQEEAISKDIPIEKGWPRIEAYALGTLSYRPANVVGYWFRDGGVQVLPGKDTLEVPVDVVPAGESAGRC